MDLHKDYVKNKYQIEEEAVSKKKLYFSNSNYDNAFVHWQGNI